MRSQSARLFAALVCAAPLLALAGCSSSPQEQAADLRRAYSLELKETAIKELKTPLSGAEAASAELAAKAAATEAASAAASAAAANDPAALPVLPDAPAGPRRVEVNLGILLKRSRPEALPGITLDIRQIDPFKQVKKTYRHYLELPPGTPMLQDESYRFAFVAEDFVDGDAFQVEIRPEVPAAERAAYRELQ